jgi:hypothetical protein
LGLSVLTAGLFLVIGWRFRTPNDSCRRRVSLMKPLWLLWLSSAPYCYGVQEQGY